jgi:hypothetical protein
MELTKKSLNSGQAEASACVEALLDVETKNELSQSSLAALLQLWVAKVDLATCRHQRQQGIKVGSRNDGKETPKK